MRTISLRMSYSDLVPFTFAGFSETEGPLGLNLCGHLYGAHIEFALMQFQSLKLLLYLNPGGSRLFFQ